MKVVIHASDIAYLDHVAEQITEGYTSGHYDRHNHWEIAEE